MTMQLTPSNRASFTDVAVPTDANGERFRNCQFLRLVAKHKTFKKCDFKYSTFDSCYLPHCVFDSCDFTGCRFIATNLRESTFAGCTFDYASFERTYVEPDILEHGCPGTENRQLYFARTLRVNFQQIGNNQAVNRAIQTELGATRIHLKKAWRSTESYYRKKYTGIKRARIFGEWLKFVLLDLLWGNGESILKVGRAALLFLLLMATIDVILFGDPGSIQSYIESLIFVPQVFIGATVPVNYPGGYLALVILAKLVALALFVSIIIKQMNRR